MQRYPRSLTEFKTSNYLPKDHFTNLKRWDHFTMHAPLWTEVLDHFFKGKQDLKFLELGTGNGLCANFMLDNYDCYVDTVDIEESRIVEEDGQEYTISTLGNLQPFIYQGRCSFHHMSTKEFLLANQDKEYDFVYVDAAHTKDWVLFDAINSFSLLKVDGLMIFDDYGVPECGEGIDAFLNGYEKRVNVFFKQWQVMLNKLSHLE